MTGFEQRVFLCSSHKYRMYLLKTNLVNLEMQKVGKYIFYYLGKGSKCKRCRLDRCLEIGLRADKVLLDEMQRKKYTGA